MENRYFSLVKDLRTSGNYFIGVKNDKSIAFDSLERAIIYHEEREMVANTWMPTAPLAMSTDPKFSCKAGGKVNTIKSKKSQSTLKNFLSTSVGSQNSLNLLHSIDASQAAQVRSQVQPQL